MSENVACNNKLQNGNFTLLRKAAAVIEPVHGVWAYDNWAEFNTRYFDGGLSVGGIVFGLTPHGHALGQYRSGQNRITLHISMIDSDKSNAWGIGALLGVKFTLDVLLHEMIHQSVEQRQERIAVGDTPRSYTSHNNSWWVSEINRIAPLLGLSANAAVITQKRVGGKVQWFVPDGCMSQSELGRWPYTARPDGYYEAPAKERFPHLFGDM